MAKEQGLNYKSVEAVKQESIIQGATKRYLAALTFTGLNSKRHKSLKANVKHGWVRNNMDSPPRTC